MYRFINWFTSSVALPLIPMAGVWLIKGVESGTFTVSNINGSDLLFASAMVCVISLIKLKNVADKELLEGLTNIFSFGLVVSMVLFAWSLVYQVQADLSIQSFFDLVTKALNDGTDIKAVASSIDPLSYNSKIEAFRLIGFIVTIVVVPTSIIFTFTYDLDK
ncbi:hypothetical protein [Plesiomonas shigelloides]|uniref:hypothetical protein n=1 Tax=Plesiomonas shigelloides TaxID=703 RepID=UPI0012620870|nr:hypothetical protein [Plesiomonas shigelloides]KAB7690237.1 hypothetical protein GBN28_06075 [Plesiomonas shigelloides]